MLVDDDNDDIWGSMDHVVYNVYNEISTFIPAGLCYEHGDLALPDMLG